MLFTLLFRTSYTLTSDCRTSIIRTGNHLNNEPFEIFSIAQTNRILIILYTNVALKKDLAFKKNKHSTLEKNADENRSVTAPVSI